MEAVRIKHSTAFAGTSITAVTVSIGGSASTTHYSNAFDILQATGATVMEQQGGAYASTTASHALTANFTSTGGNLSALTAGAVDVWVKYAVLP